MSLLYHPGRYKASRPFVKQVINAYSKYGGIPTSESYEAIKKVIKKEYDKLLLAIPGKQRPASFQVLIPEISRAMHYAAFVVFAENIFHFTSDLCEEFKLTDVENIPMSLINLPYDSFYMSFGKQKEFNLWSKGYFIDGVYVSKLSRGESVQLLISTVREDVKYDFDYNWVAIPDKYYYLKLMPDDPDQMVIDAVDKAFKKDIESRSIENIPDLSGMYLVDGRYFLAKDTRSQTTKEVIDDLQEGYIVMQSALKLIINGLYFLSAFRNEIAIGWPPNTPAEMLNQYLSQSKRESQKAKARLKEMGYSIIHLCSIPKEVPLKADTDGLVSKGKGKISHWRRGHWRNQAYGPGRNERKLIWIRPVLINADSNTLPQGHVYEIR